MQEEKEKQAVKLSFEEYEKMTKAILYHLQSLQQNNEEFSGVSEKEIV